MSELGSHNGDGIRFRMYLSAPKGGVAQMLRDPAGDWVTYDEIARLKAEVERLDTLCKQLGKQHSDISCENIMLRKAGDALYENQLEGMEIVGGVVEDCPLMMAWTAAKEGKSV